jgi:lysine 2,3-aminomutase
VLGAWLFPYRESWMTSGSQRRRLTSPKDLIEAGLAEPDRLPELEAIARRYAIGLTPALAALVRSEGPSDPIALQFVPDARELIRDPAERDDPIGDDAMSPVKGLVHRYPDRVLIKLVAVCAVYCRFCFRRERVGPGSGALTAAEFIAAIDYVRTHEGIWEVILTGGDPLTLSPRRIAEVTQALAAIDHVKVLRWHTRLPVAAPERVTKAVARALMAERKTTVVAVHANHARELTESARSACRRLAEEGAMLVSQTVLLKGVNDDPETLIDLMRAFVEARVKPYYLHHGDLAPGTTHWRVPIARGQELMRILRARLSGLATPTYMLDIPGGHGKAPIGPQWIHSGEDGEHVVTDPQGVQHAYADRLGADG